MKEPQIEKNKLPVWLKVILLLFPFVIACCRFRTIDNDFWFLYKTGEHIVNNGFPHTDFLSMHSNMKLVVQQWLSTVIFYFVYSSLGRIGLFCLLYGCYACICALTYRLNLLITKNELVSVVLAGLTDLLIFNQLIVTRPQIFTYILLLLEILILEKHVSTRKNIYLAGIPLISLALINFHASMWPMIFVFMLPYIAGAVPVKIKAFKLEAEGSLLALIAAFAAGAIVGLANPYGTDNMFYLFASYGDNQLGTTIYEMLPTDIGTHIGKMLFGLIIIMVIAGFFYNKKRFSVRFFCLFFGTLLLALMHRKGTPYFFIFGVSSFSYMIKDVEIRLPSSITSKLTRRVRIMLAALLIMFTVCLCTEYLVKSLVAEPGRTAHYDRLDEVAKILGKSEDPVVLYANFSDGQYMEYKDFHPYIDGRAELFLIQNNGEFDYYSEYYELRSANMYYRDFTDKYQFNYLLLNGTSDRYLLMSLLYDDDFELKYENSEVYLFARK